MKKTTRNLLIMLAVLVLLGGGAAALLLLGGGDGEELPDTSSLSAENVTLLARDAEDAQAVNVANSRGEYRLVRSENNGKTRYLPEGMENYPVNDSNSSSDANTLLSLQAVKTLGELDDLAEYGLSGESAAKITVEYSDGQKESYTLGDPSPETTGRYALKDGVVYIVGGVNERVFGSPLEYLSTSVYSVSTRTETVVDEDGSASDEEAEDIMDYLTLSGKNFPETVQIDHEPTDFNEYRMTEPMLAESDTTRFQNILADLKSLSALSVAGLIENGTDLGQYGLDEPFARVSFSMNGEAHELAVSDLNSDGERYLAADDTGMVYRVARGTVSSWAECTAMDLRMSYIWIPSISEVQNLTVTLGDGTVYSYDTVRTKNEEKSKNGTVVYDQTVTDAEGKDVSLDDFKTFYKELIGIPVFSMEKASWSGTPAMKAEYHFFEGGCDTVEFYTTDQSRYAAVLNGSFSGQCRKLDVDKAMGLLPG